MASSVSTNGVSSSVVSAPTSVSTGPSFTGVTITLTKSDAVAESTSETVNVNISEPFQSCTAPNVTSKPSMDTVTFMLPETDRTKTSSSISSTKLLRSSTRLPSSSNVKLSGKTMVGESFMGLTVIVTAAIDEKTIPSKARKVKESPPL